MKTASVFTREKEVEDVVVGEGHTDVLNYVCVRKE